MIYTAVDNFYLQKELLENSPSRADGVSSLDEQQLRLYGCDLISKVGILLNCPQQVLATAQVLLHRFYCKKSFKNYLVKHIAIGCILLASKMEEVHQDVRDICLVTHRVLQLQEQQEFREPIRVLDLHSSEYVKLKANIFKAERHILKNLQFIMHVDHPHKFTLTLLKVLFMRNIQEELLQEAWNLANDSLRTTLCVQYKSNVIACGIIYLAAQRQKIVLPEQTEWWTICKVDRQDLMEVVFTLQELYLMKKPVYVPVFHADSLKQAKGMTSEAEKPEHSSLSHSSERRSNSSSSDVKHQSSIDDDNRSDSENKAEQKQLGDDDMDADDQPCARPKKIPKFSNHNKEPPPPPPHATRDSQSLQFRPHRRGDRDEYQPREYDESVERERRGRSREPMGRGRLRENEAVGVGVNHHERSRSRGEGGYEWEQRRERFARGRDYEEGEFYRRRYDNRQGSKYSRGLKKWGHADRSRERDYGGRRKHQ